MEKELETGGRWLDPNLADVYKQYEETRDRIIAGFRARYEPDEPLSATQLERRRPPRSNEEACQLINNLREELEPIHRMMADLKMRYWIPIIIVPRPSPEDSRG
jgi:hypothetical protein